MSWLTVILALLKIFGPPILKLIEDLLKDAAMDTQSASGGPPTDINAFRQELNKVFDKAEAKLPWWKFWTARKKIALKFARRVALKRVKPLHAVAMGMSAVSIPPLEADEAREQSEVAA